MKITKPSKPILYRKPGEYVLSWLMVDRSRDPPYLHGSNILDGRFAFGAQGKYRLTVPEGTLSFETQHLR